MEPTASQATRDALVVFEKQLDDASKIVDQVKNGPTGQISGHALLAISQQLNAFGRILAHVLRQASQEDDEQEQQG